MTAPAPTAPTTWRSPADRVIHRRGRSYPGWLAVLAAAMVSPALAQVGLSASVTSDYQYRGISLSDGRPALSLTANYDHRSGGYASATVIAESTSNNGVQIMGSEEYLGVARRMPSGDTWDAGFYHRRLRQFYYGTQASDDFEVYAGLQKGHLSYYLYYSPYYYGARYQNLYADITGSLRPAKHIRLFGHFGVTTPVSAPAAPGLHLERYDFRLGAAVEFKAGVLQMAWTATTPESGYLPGRSQSHRAVVFSATHYF